MADGGILKINASDIAYYMQCPMRFKLQGWRRPETKNAKPKLVLTEYVTTTLTECVKAILMRHAFDGVAPSLGAVLRLWNDAWKYINKRFGNDENINNVYIKSTFKLQEYYHKHINRTDQCRQVPLMYDYKFVLNYDNVDIVGVVDFGFFTKTKLSEEVDLAFIGGDITSKIGDTVRSSYNVLVSVYKFREDFGLSCKHVLYYNPYSMHWLKVDMPYTTKQLYGIIYDACRAFYSRIGYRNPSNHCKSCPFNKNTMCEF